MSCELSCSTVVLPRDIQFIHVHHVHQKLLAKLYFVVGWPKIAINHLFNYNIFCSILD